MINKKGVKGVAWRF